MATLARYTLPLPGYTQPGYCPHTAAPGVSAVPAVVSEQAVGALAPLLPWVDP